MTAYNTLETIFRRWNALGNASSMLHWDNATMMPSGSGDVRGEQLMVLAELSHEIITQPMLGDVFAKAESELASLDDWQQANMREMKRLWRHATAVPVELVSALTKACHESELFWRMARPENNFKDFIPYQTKVLELVRESAGAKASSLGLSPYDALLDQYDPGTQSITIDAIFDDLTGFLPDFIKAVIERQASQKPPVEVGETIPVSAQKALGIEFMQKVGFDFARGRLDESVHPFCGGVPGDIRLTARYNEQDFLSGFFAVMHETGHALYERGLPASYARQPVGEAAGMAVHESQSLIMEMQACRGDAYLGWLGTQMHAAFGGAPADYACANLARLWRRVDRSLIRVDADEMTYPAHVILRFQLEQALIAGDLVVADLPGAWNDGLHDLLGVRPANDREGCLQDIHWYDGAFGYFPSYTLGAMAAAQLMQVARVAEPTIGDALAEGSLAPLLGWLRRHVHAQGSLMGFEALLTQATGGPLDPAAFEQHLASRYLP